MNINKILSAIKNTTLVYLLLAVSLLVVMGVSETAYGAACSGTYSAGTLADACSDQTKSPTPMPCCISAGVSIPHAYYIYNGGTVGSGGTQFWASITSSSCTQNVMIPGKDTTEWGYFSNSSLRPTCIAISYARGNTNSTVTSGAKTWIGGNGSGASMTNWSNANNWSPTGVPTSTDVVYFDEFSQTTSVTIDINAQAAAIVVDTNFPSSNASSTITVASNVTLDILGTGAVNGIIMQSNNAVTFDARLAQYVHSIAGAPTTGGLIISKASNIYLPSNFANTTANNFSFITLSNGTVGDTTASSLVNMKVEGSINISSGTFNTGTHANSAIAVANDILMTGGTFGFAGVAGTGTS
jgi:hypothetical protein